MRVIVLLSHCGLDQLRRLPSGLVRRGVSKDGCSGEEPGDGGEVDKFSWVAFLVNKRFLMTHNSRGSIVAFR